MNNKNENIFIVHSDYKDRGYVIEYSDSMRAAIIEGIRQRAGKAEDIESLPFYDDDYLFISSLVLRAHAAYSRINYDPLHNRLDEGCSELPFVYLRFIEGGDVERSPNGEMVPKDKSLEVKAYKKTEKYELSFNRYMLYRVLEFLKKVFDDNEELALSIPAGKGLAFTSLEKEDALVAAAQLRMCGLEQEAKEYMQYIFSREEGGYISPPIMQIYNIGEGKNIRKIHAMSVYDPTQDKITTQLRKPIYLTSGFNRWFYRRNELVRRLFVAVFEFIVFHETAHVANGHCDLPKSYGEQKEVSVCAEANADDTAIRWWIADLVFDTEDGTLEGRRLSRTKEELSEEIEIRVLGAYIALSWVFRDEERTWSGKTLDDFIQNEKARHPIYQFRTFNTINRAMNLLAGYVPAGELEPLLTLDNLLVDEDMVAEITKGTLDMLTSFETYFVETYRDSRSTEKKLADTLQFEENSQPITVEKIPFLMPVYFDRAAKESKDILEFWPTLRTELYKHKVYSKLYDNIG